MRVFANPTVQLTINKFNAYSFDGLRGFGMYSSKNTTYYYVMDYGYGKVYILSDQWSFISSKEFRYPCYMISINNSLYMNGNDNV